MHHPLRVMCPALLVWAASAIVWIKSGAPLTVMLNNKTVAL
jgi:hypothetical protein